MKSSCVLLIFASVFIVGCAGSSPLSPDSVSSARAVVSASPTSAAQAFFPPINPAEISCPIRCATDPCRVAGPPHWKSISRRWKAPTPTKYEIFRCSASNVYEPFARLEVPSPAHRAEWYGINGKYLVRVRTINCGGLGNWSDEFLHALDDGTADRRSPPAPGPQCVTGCEPPPKPQCMTGCEPPPGPQCMAGCQPPPGLAVRDGLRLKEFTRASVSARVFEVL